MGLSYPQGVLIQMVMALSILLVLLRQWIAIPLKFIQILLQMTQIRPQWTLILLLISVPVQLSRMMFPTEMPILNFFCKYLG